MKKSELEKVGKNRTNVLGGCVLCKRQSILPLGHSTLAVEMREEREREREISRRVTVVGSSL